MAKGFKDSSGKFHPTGNNGTSSREKSVNVEGMSLSLFEKHEGKKAVEKDVDATIRKLRGAVDNITNGAEDLYVRIDSKGEMIDRQLDKLNTMLVLIDDPNNLNENMKINLSKTVEEIASRSNVLEADVKTLVRGQDFNDIDDASEEILSELTESGVGIHDEFKNPLDQMNAGFDKVFISGGNINDKAIELLSFIRTINAGKSKEGIVIATQRQVEDVKNQINLAKEGIDEMKTGKVRLISELKIEFNLPLATRE